MFGSGHTPSSLASTAEKTVVTARNIPMEEATVFRPHATASQADQPRPRLFSLEAQTDDS